MDIVYGGLKVKDCSKEQIAFGVEFEKGTKCESSRVL
jgi:hypothetical protein